MAKKVSEADFLRLLEQHDVAEVARQLGISDRAVRKRRQRIRERGNVAAVQAAAKPEAKATDPEVRALRAQLRAITSEKLDADYVRRKIIGLAKAPIDTPDWLVQRRAQAGDLGVPTLFASDWHWAEKVDPRQIGGVNEYDLAIAHRRARKMIERTIHLLRNCMAGASYPGIVFALGGDMVSGDIHEELQATNEMEIMPTVLDLVGVLQWCIQQLADEFGRVFVPCVSGNHGRNTKKIRAKGRNHTSFDWLMYGILAKLFEADPRVTFLIPEGSDASWRVYGMRYRLSHGDQFRGGDGMIGALGPIIRGDHKKRSRDGQIGEGYDVLMIGHFHQLIQLQRLIVNGSLKGYDEYAYANNFGFERARQALWITHPEHGITFSMPVNVDDAPKLAADEAAAGWVSWRDCA
ncbi:hypothetical protein [Vogesella oryzae]|uniref:hypothetical protein n=1 Tax=Vogesella oryzae TaxID=1735285 RepID=UPI001581E74E|nr:hypothetical protein [Vogesella oryzae]